MSDKTVEIRVALESDYNFIMSSWLQSYREGSEFAEVIPHDTYFKYQRIAIDNILHRPTTSVIICGMQNDSDLIFGYAIYEMTRELRIVHYLYIKRAFNKFGLSHVLIKAAPFAMEKGVYASHLTHSGTKLLEKYNLSWNPYLL